MTRRILPASPKWMRVSGVILGIFLFLWLPFEDVSEDWVILFSIAICTWIAVHFSYWLKPNTKLFLLLHTLVGILSGLAITPVALFLMAFKSGVHGHGLPDFTPDQVIDVLRRTPLWGSAGLLIGLGGGILRLARVSESL